MQPQDEQQTNQTGFQPDQPASSGLPQQSGHPVVTLTPDTDQTVQNVYPSPTPVVSEAADQGDLATPAPQPVRWQATEYVHRERDQAWLAAFVVVTIVLIAVAIFLIKSLTFAILIPVMAAALMVYVHRPPQPLDYVLSRHGLHINDRLYPYAEFKGFAVIHNGGEYSIMLIPTKRFKPAVTIYFPEDAGEAIVDMLAARLPMQEMQPDIVDRLIQKLRL